MAQVTLAIKDDMQDGQQVVMGTFKSEDLPEPDASGIPPEFTPSQIFMTCIQRMWDKGGINAFVSLVCGDMLYQNQKIKEARAQAALPSVPALPEGLPSLPSPGVEDAVVIVPDTPDGAPTAPADAPLQPTTATQQQIVADQLAEAARLAGVEQTPEQIAEAAQQVVGPHDLPPDTPATLPDGTPIRVLVGAGYAKGLAK